jgi:WXXGXW repeat (2 copies)
MSQIKRFFSIVVLVFLVFKAEAQLVSINIGTRRVPPPPRHYARPACPGSDYVWRDGRWVWDNYVRDYVWYAGFWEYLPPPPPRYYHAPRGRAHGHWKKRGRY